MRVGNIAGKLCGCRTWVPHAGWALREPHTNRWVGANRWATAKRTASLFHSAEALPAACNQHGAPLAAEILLGRGQNITFYPCVVPFSFITAIVAFRWYCLPATAARLLFLVHSTHSARTRRHRKLFWNRTLLSIRLPPPCTARHRFSGLHLRIERTSSIMGAVSGTGDAYSFTRRIYRGFRHSAAEQCCTVEQRFATISNIRILCWHVWNNCRTPVLIITRLLHIVSAHNEFR